MMPNYCQPIVEYSSEPLSVTTPSWIDVTRFTQSISWFAGTDQDLDAPQNGGATIVLKNGDRRFEPDYTGSPYYPNIVPLRPFRVSIITDGSTLRLAQGIERARRTAGRRFESCRGHSSTAAGSLRSRGGESACNPSASCGKMGNVRRAKRTPVLSPELDQAQ